ncbi:hypothetical protein KXV52_009354, partial [Aspergillus fumigatus]
MNMGDQRSSSVPTVVTTEPDSSISALRYEDTVALEDSGTIRSASVPTAHDYVSCSEKRSASTSASSSDNHGSKFESVAFASHRNSSTESGFAPSSASIAKDKRLTPPEDSHSTFSRRSVRSIPSIIVND